MPASLDKKSVIQISACQNCYKNSDGNSDDKTSSHGKSFQILGLKSEVHLGLRNKS